MKRCILWLIILCILTLLPTAAWASGELSGKIEGNTMAITWNLPCSGTCTLTVYQTGWPICVWNVCGENGGTCVPLGDVRGSYSIRLQTAQGCYSANVNAPSAAKTPLPTAVETEKPTDVEFDVTPKPVEVTTPMPAESATPTASAVPTPSASPTPTFTPAPPAQTRTPAVTAKPTEPVSSRTDLAAEVVRLVNEERAKQGLSALRTDDELTRAACVRASEIATSFSHTRPSGASWSTVSASAYGENIARGQRSAEKVMASWMTSEGHRANILRASYSSIGVCAVVSGGVTYWVQLFGH